MNNEKDANPNFETQDINKNSLPKEKTRGHTSSFRRHKAFMNIETEYIINDDGKKYLKDQKDVKESEIPPKDTKNKFFFDKLMDAANQNRPEGKIALWKNTLRLQIAFAISYPNRKDKKFMTAGEIHSSGLPIIVADYIKKHGSRFGIRKVEVKPFLRADDHLKIYLNCPSGSLSSSQHPLSNGTKTLATILGMQVAMRFMNCNQYHRKEFQKEVRDRFHVDLCSRTTEPVIQTLLERCLRLFLNTYIIRKYNSSFSDNHADEIKDSVPQIDQLAEAMTSITLENKQSERLQKAFSLLSDIVKFKEGVIPTFSNSDTSKSRAERQTAQWIFQTALMRGEKRMDEIESNDLIREIPGLMTSYHDRPNKLVRQQDLYNSRNMNEEMTFGRAERESVQQVASQVSSSLSSSVESQSIPPLLNRCHVEDHNNLVVSESHGSAQNTMMKISTEKASDIGTSAALIPSTVSDFLGGTEVSKRVKQKSNEASLAANEGKIRLASTNNQNLDRKRFRKKIREEKKTCLINFTDMTFDLDFNSSITIKNDFSDLTATPTMRKQFSVTNNECEFVLERIDISNDLNKQVDIQAQKLHLTRSKGTSSRNAIDVDESNPIELIDLTAKQSKDQEKEFDSRFDFEVTKVVVHHKYEASSNPSNKSKTKRNKRNKSD